MIQIWLILHIMTSQHPICWRNIHCWCSFELEGSSAHPWIGWWLWRTEFHVSFACLWAGTGSKYNIIFLFAIDFFYYFLTKTNLALVVTDLHSMFDLWIVIKNSELRSIFLHILLVFILIKCINKTLIQNY